jgi:hypothetical protein
MRSALSVKVAQKLGPCQADPTSRCKIIPNCESVSQNFGKCLENLAF